VGELESILKNFLHIVMAVFLMTSAYAEVPTVVTDKYEIVRPKKPWRPPKWHPPLVYFPEEKPMPLRRRRKVTRPLFEMAVFGGMQNLGLSGVAAELDVSEFTRGTYFAMEGHYLVTPVLSVFSRLEFLSARRSVNPVIGTGPLDANLSSFPVSLGISFQPFELSGSFFLSVSAMAGYAIQSQFSVAQTTPLAAAQIKESVPYFAGKSTMGYRVSNLGYLMLEGGYRYLKIQSSDPNLTGTLLGAPSEVNLGGLYIGAGFALLMY